MAKKRFLLFFLLISVLEATQLYSIVGYGENPRYAQITRDANNVFRFNNGSQGVNIIGKMKDPEDWKFLDEESYVPLKNTNDLRAGFKKGSANAKEKKDTSHFVFINDHGSAPENVTKPISAKISIYSFGQNYAFREGQVDNDIPLSDLDKVMKEELPAGDSKHILAIQCYAAGVHDISFSNPNTCSAAASYYWKPTTSTEGVNLYGQGFLDEFSKRKFDFDGDGKTNMWEGHFAGILHDSKNAGQNQLSSFAFADKVLGKAGYDMVAIVKDSKKNNAKNGTLHQSLSSNSNVFQLHYQLRSSGLLSVYSVNNKKVPPVLKAKQPQHGSGKSNSDGEGHPLEEVGDVLVDNKIASWSDITSEEWAFLPQELRNYFLKLKESKVFNNEKDIVKAAEVQSRLDAVDKNWRTKESDFEALKTSIASMKSMLSGDKIDPTKLKANEFALWNDLALRVDLGRLPFKLSDHDEPENHARELLDLYLKAESKSFESNRVDMTAEVRSIQKGAKLDSQSLSARMGIIHQVKRVAEFLAKASQTQKDTFNRLLKCEMEAL